jgi:hypothetical protein
LPPDDEAVHDLGMSERTNRDFLALASSARVDVLAAAAVPA